MPKLIITETQYKRLVEAIHPSVAYRDVDSVNSVLNGSRDVGFIADYSTKTNELLKDAISSGLKTIPIKQNTGITAYVFYRTGAEEDAQRLASIARKNNGYLPTKSPEETYIIGILLGYEKEAVKEFVLSKFPDFKFY